MIHRARLRILPLVVVLAVAAAPAAYAAEFAAFPWPLRLVLGLVALAVATAPAYWFGARAEADLAQRLAAGIDAALRRHEHGSLSGHEMKTPLTGIKAYLELLADGDADDDATRAEFLAGIGSQVERLERTIDELLAPMSGGGRRVVPRTESGAASDTFVEPATLGKSSGFEGD